MPNTNKYQGVSGKIIQIGSPAIPIASTTPLCVHTTNILEVYCRLLLNSSTILEHLDMNLFFLAQIHLIGILVVKNIDGYLKI
jgi:hypothetical protein